MLDIGLRRRSATPCDRVSRRDILRVGGLSALGLTLPGVLRGESQRPATAAKPRAKSVILIYLGGGLSHHDSFDLKPDAPSEIRGKYNPIGTSVAGLQIGERLPKTAQVMDRLTLVRSGAHNNDHHETATNWVLSGRFGTPFGDFPAMGAVVAHELGFTGTLPPYMAVPQNPSFTWELGKSAFLGGRYESFKTGDPNAKDFKVPDVALLEKLSQQRINRRQNLLQAVDGLARGVEHSDALATYDEFQRRAATMILSSEARRAFAIDDERTALRDQYGRTTFGQSCLLARRLVENGVRFVTVNYGGWDHHAKIFEGLDRMLPIFDQGFSTLITDMQSRGLLRDTLVLVMGEFGRSPKINKDAGRDHWGPAGSLLFAGAGVREGFVLGRTDKQGGEVLERPVRPADVAYTVYDALGLDPRKSLLDPTGRPIEILDQGAPVRELFG